MNALRRAGLVGLLVLVALGGCDVALVTVAVMAKNKKSSDSSSPAAAPDVSYHVWIADVLTGTDADEAASIVTRGGVPGGSWTQIGTGLASQTFNPVQAAANVHYVLVQVGDLLPYHLDSIEVTDAAGSVIAWAAGTVYFDHTTTPTEVLGKPDGLTADLTGIVGHKAFVFVKFAGPVDAFRLSLWSTTLGSGDVAQTISFDPGSNTDQRSGGAGLSATGEIFIAYEEGVSPTRSISILPIDSSGTPQASVPLENNITNATGSEALVVGPGNDVYVAWSSGTKDIRVRRYNFDFSSTFWTQPFSSSGPGAARVEAHGLAVNGIGDAYVAGGLDFGTNPTPNFGHFLQKVTKVTHASWVSPPTPPLDLTHSTYWRGVDIRDVTGPTDTQIFQTGNLTNGLLPASQDLFSRHSLESTTGASNWDQSTEGGDDLHEQGNAVRVDASGNVYVGGFLNHTATKKDGAILKFSNAGVPAGGAFPLLYNGAADGDDEVLDLAVDTNGDIFAVGTESVAGPRTVMWVRRYAADGSILWTRTHEGTDPAGSSRAVTVQLSATHVFVIGDVANTTTNRDLHVRKYVK